MGLYTPAAGSQADPNAFGNSMAAIDAAFENTFGNGILSGLALSSNGNMSAGSALVGHVISIEAPANILSILLAVTHNGTLDVYATQPQYQSNSVTGLGVAGTYPDAAGEDSISFVAVPTGTGLPGSIQGALVATVTLSGGSITVVNNGPAARINIVTPQTMSTQFGKMQKMRAAIPAQLTAPLPNKILLICSAALTILTARLAVLTAPVGSAIVADIEHIPVTNGVSGSPLAVWETSANRPQIAAGSNVGNYAPTPDGSYSCGANDLVTIDLAQVGSTTPGTNLAIEIDYQFQ